MKKLLALFAALALVLTLFAACGKKENNDANAEQNATNVSTEETETKENADKNDSDNNVSAQKIVNDDGEEFIVDTSVKGTIKEGAASIHDSKVVLNGKEYNFPIKISDLIADGWHFSENQVAEDDVAPETLALTNGVYLFSANGDEITIRSVYNELSEAAPIEDCLAAGIKIDAESEDDIDFVYPGGITKDSSAADVLSIFGDPNKTNDFDYGYNLDEQLSYENNNNSGITYHFTFNEDGTLSSCSMQVEEF